MLNRLIIRNIVLIEHLELNLTAGLIVLTGETGAGKSILLDALGLATGSRGDSGLVRAGSDKAEVVATFQLSNHHPVFAMLQEYDIAADWHDELILKRSITKDGRSAASINGSPVNIGFLKQVGQQLFEIHGQFDQYGLLERNQHLALLDQYADNAALLHDVSVAFEGWKEKKAALIALQKEHAMLSEEREFLKDAIAELEAFDPKHQEESEILAAKAKVTHAKRLVDQLATVVKKTSDGEQSAVQQIFAAQKALTRLLDIDEQSIQTQLNAFDEKLEKLSVHLESFNEELQAYIDEFSDGAAMSADLEERLHNLRSLARKYQIQPDQLAEQLDEFNLRFAKIEGFDDNQTAAQTAELAAKQAYRQRAQALSEKRRAAAKTMGVNITAELAPLKLDKVRFEVVFDDYEEDAWHSGGLERAEFMVSTNPGAPFGPLKKIASGGELSRLMLAMKVVLHSDAGLKTIVFDEVDAGIGGATADAVGGRLHRLSQGQQILVVTHSPQVAGKGQQHFRVEKSDQGGMTTTNVVELPQDARQLEIARMLSGQDINDAALQAAKALMVA